MLMLHVRRLSFLASFMGLSLNSGMATELADNSKNLPLPLNASDFNLHSAAEVAVGRLLFFDPILSGNKNISCATCHHPRFGTSDGMSLSIGEGGTGLGPKRMPTLGDNQPEERIGRNAPALFNLGHKDIAVLFHDGRLEKDESRKAGFRTPLDDDMVSGFSGLVSAQSMFPVLSGDEMAGHYSENEISSAVRRGEMTGEGGAWQLIAKRVAAIPAYGDALVALHDGMSKPEDIAFTDISNAVAAFMESEFRADNSRFDHYLAGNKDALSPLEKTGMDLFYGKANCASCHAGALMTDQQFHAIAMPQIGPGRKARFESHNKDFGRMRVTGHESDLYKFRTPPLRNVALTAPYGHAGAYPDLESTIRHHLDPIAALKNYDRSLAKLAPFNAVAEHDFAELDNPDEMTAIAAANQLQPIALENNEVQALVAFLEALTDDSFLRRVTIPETVPSGLAIDR